MKTVFILIVSLFFLVIIPFVIHLQVNNLKEQGAQFTQHFYLEKEYRDQSHLFSVLGNVLSTNVNMVFLWCCDCILFYAKATGLTYEELNVYLFIIWQPYLILLFMYLFFNEWHKFNKYKKQVRIN